MKLSTEKKIKSLIATLVKLLFGILIVLKIITWYDNRENKAKIDANDALELSSKDTLERSKNKPIENRRFVSDESTHNVQKPTIKQKTEASDEVYNHTTFDKNVNNIGVLIFNDLDLDINIANTLELTFFKDYTSLSHLISLKEMDSGVKSSLLKGDFSMFEKKISNLKNVCVGTVKYNFRTSKLNSKMIICDLELAYTVYDTKGFKNKNLSKSDIYTGQGFTKHEARNNAMKRIQ
jgi:hypothetical protein